MSMDELVTLEEIRGAARRIAGTAVRTPLVELAGTGIWIKCESAQPIGSFKLRGAFNTIAQLPLEQVKRGVITYSSGNHAQGVAYSARALGGKAVIVMPDNAPGVKVEATRALGADVVFVGAASSARKEKAEALAAEFGYTVIPPYDHPHIVAGQATCGLEIVEEMPEVDLVLSPVSGGGLLSGTATAVKRCAEAGSAKAGVQVWGAEPELAADAKESFETGKLVEWPAELTSRTLGDGLRTQSLGRLNFQHILRFVDGIAAVSEEEILEAMRRLLKDTSLVPEPSGAVTLAAALFHRRELPAAERVVVILSGGNVDPALLARLQTEAQVGSVQ